MPIEMPGSVYLVFMLLDIISNNWNKCFYKGLAQLPVMESFRKVVLAAQQKTPNLNALRRHIQEHILFSYIAILGPISVQMLREFLILAQ